MCIRDRYSVQWLPSLLVFCHSSLHLAAGCRALRYPNRWTLFLLSFPFPAASSPVLHHIHLMPEWICHLAMLFLFLKFGRCRRSIRGLLAPDWLTVSTPVSCQGFAANLSDGSHLRIGSLWLLQAGTGSRGCRCSYSLYTLPTHCATLAILQAFLIWIFEAKFFLFFWQYD